MAPQSARFDVDLTRYATSVTHCGNQREGETEILSKIHTVLGASSLHVDMIRSASVDLLERLEERFGDELRSVGYYDPTGNDFVYVREDVKASYEAADFDRVFRTIRLEALDRDHQESLYTHGRLESTVRCFDAATEIHLAVTDRQGIVAAVDARAIDDLRGTIDTRLDVVDEWINSRDESSEGDDGSNETEDERTDGDDEGSVGDDQVADEDDERTDPDNERTDIEDEEE